MLGALAPDAKTLDSEHAHHRQRRSMVASCTAACMTSVPLTVRGSDPRAGDPPPRRLSSSVVPLRLHASCTTSAQAIVTPPPPSRCSRLPVATDPPSSFGVGRPSTRQICHRNTLNRPPLCLSFCVVCRMGSQSMDHLSFSTMMGLKSHFDSRSNRVEEG